jgi:phage-related protein
LRNIEPMSPGDPPLFEIEFYADESGDMPCLRWIREDLSPTKRRALGMAMNEVLQRHGVQVVGERSWGRQLGQGLFEFRVDRTVKPDDEIAEKLVLRVFCHAHGDRKILVLHGYDKGKSQSSRRQQREIEAARSRLASWRAIEAEQRTKPRGRGVGGSKPAARRKR